MKIYLLFLSGMLLLGCTQVFSQNYPIFGDGIKVSIKGLTFDAMEPFISLDGNTLFFNSLNSGGNTNLYFATKVNDSTFNYIGMVNGTYDTSANHLDAVASLDSLNNFYWTSLRGYPSAMENLHRGIYLNGTVSSISRVYGNFNTDDFKYPFGWLIMDAAINFNGDLLYYCNAKFDFSNASCGGAPCESIIGAAQKVNDSTFNKLPNSAAIFDKVNDSMNYIVYAPQVTKDGLELYFTRLKKNTANTEICVSVRKNKQASFSLPMVIYSNLGQLPEAASPTTDKRIIYYHQKDKTGVFKIFLRYRISTSALNEHQIKKDVKVFPNPTKSIFNVALPLNGEQFNISIFSAIGQEIYTSYKDTSVDITNFAKGVYFVIVNQNNKIWRTKIIKN